MKKNKTSTYRWLPIAVILFLQLLVIGLSTRVYLRYTNTLARHPQWQVSKTTLAHPGSDGPAFRDSTQPLAEHALNLSAWRGYHEVLLTKPYEWDTISVDFLPASNAYFYLIINKDSQTFQAVRISFSQMYRSAFITARYTGEFISEEPLSHVTYDSNQGWQNLTLRYQDPERTQLQIAVNNQTIATVNAPAVAHSQIGFRSGVTTIFIDNVSVKNNQQIVFQETFDNYGHFWPMVISWYAALTVIEFLLWKFLITHASARKTAISIIFNGLIGIMILAIALVLARKFVLTRYPTEEKLIQSYISDYALLAQQKNDELFSSYPVKKPTTKRIMFVGSSQIVGEGAAQKDEDVVSQFCNLLNQNPPVKGYTYECLSASLNGIYAPQLAVNFKSLWYQLQPDVVVLNVGNNDEGKTDPTLFQKTLEDFIKLSVDYQFKLVFVAEAVSLESVAHLHNHEIMRTVAEENQIQFIDMNHYLSLQNQRGILWWDHVHMTSFGYHLMAEKLLADLKPTISK